MQMQLHTLLAGSRILSLRHRSDHDGIGLEHHLIGEIIHHQSTHDPNNRPDLDALYNRVGLLLLHKPADADGRSIVRHIKFHHNGVPLGQFLVIKGKYPALHDHITHIQVNVTHGCHITPERLSEDRIRSYRRSRLLFLFRSDHRALADLFSPKPFHGIKQRLALQGITGLKSDGNITTKPLFQLGSDLRRSLFQLLLAIAPQPAEQTIVVPFPTAAGQRTAEHGILVDKHPFQFFRLNFM